MGQLLGQNWGNVEWVSSATSSGEMLNGSVVGPELGKC